MWLMKPKIFIIWLLREKVFLSLDLKQKCSNGGMVEIQAIVNLETMIFKEGGLIRGLDSRHCAANWEGVGGWLSWGDFPQN